MIELADCQWPAVTEPYATALREAVAFGLARYPLAGIVASGSILRGQAGPSSDWDLHLIHREPQRQRVQQRFNGVPAEIFVNPPAALRGYFRDEHALLRPLTAHMLATGHIVAANDPVVSELVAEAAAWLAEPIIVSEDQLVQKRYFAVDQLDNARDLRVADPANSRLLLNQAVSMMLEYPFWASGRFLPRHKQFLAGLADLDPTCAELARGFFLASELDEAFDLAERIAAHAVGVTEFFAWSSPLNVVEGMDNNN